MEAGVERKTPEDFVIGSLPFPALLVENDEAGVAIQLKVIAMP